MSLVSLQNLSAAATPPNVQQFYSDMEGLFADLKAASQTLPHNFKIRLKELSYHAQSIVNSSLDNQITILYQVEVIFKEIEKSAAAASTSKSQFNGDAYVEFTNTIMIGVVEKVPAH